METAVVGIPLECSIEQILGASLQQLCELDDAGWLARLEPILKVQEGIFASIPKKQPGVTTIPGSKSRAPGIPPVMRAGRDPVALLKSGMSPEQAQMTMLASMGVKFTPEMLLALKQVKKPV